MIKKGLENQRKNSQQLELKNEKTLKEISKIKRLKKAKGITLIALIITILFSYDEKIKCSNSKDFLLTTIL